MSGIFPATPSPNSITMRSVQPTRETISHSLKRNTRTTNAQRWAVTLAYARRERADLMPIFAFVVAQRGRYDTFTWVMPTPLKTPRGTGVVGSPNPTVAGSPDQSGRSITTTGWVANSTPLKAGDFVKFASHAKVYMATADMTVTAGGAGTMSIEPAPLQSLANGDAIITTNIPFTMGLASDEHSMSLDIGSIFGVQEIELVEVC